MEHIYLSHHGIKGQKWGIRRFQLKNGKLTAAGKKRYGEDDEEQKKKAEEDSAPKKKSVSEMSDQELRDAVTKAQNRAQLEEQYRKYYEKPVQQKQVSAGQKFAKEVLKKVVVDPAIEAASKGMKNSFDKAINDKFNKKQEDSIRDLVKRDIRDLNESQLKRVVDYKDLEKKLNEHNDRDSVMERESKRIDFEQKKLSYEKNLMLRDLTAKQLEKATAEAEKAVKDLEMTSYVKDKEEAVRRGQEAVRQMFEAPMALPAPKDNLKHSDILEHHGIKGQKWGVRRFQNKNGSLTEDGKKRYHDTLGDEWPANTVRTDLKEGEYYSTTDKPKKFKTFLDVSNWNEFEDGKIRDMVSLNQIDYKKAEELSDALTKQTKIEFQKVVALEKNQSEVLEHHGIKGQRWGVRRYQKKDGSLTAAGKKRILTYEQRAKNKMDEYNEKHPERSKEVNFKIMMYKEADRETDIHKRKISAMGNATAVGTMASYGLAGVPGLALSSAAAITVAKGEEYVYKKRLYTLAELAAKEVKHSDILEHHGIKGQRWGIRRFQNKDGTLTSAGKKRYSDDDEVVMKKGEVGNHISGTRTIRLNRNETYLYDPNNEHDRQVYEGAYAEYVKLGKGYCKRYIHEYEFKKDLISPSAEKRVELFIDMYRDNPALYSTSLNAVKGSYQKADYKTLTDKNKNIASYKKEFDENTSDKELRKYGYDTFTALQEYGSKTPAVKSYYDKVKDLGYNALVDDNNRSVYNDAVKPFIVLNGKKTLKEKNVELLTDIEQKEQEEKLRKYMKKKYGKNNIAL